MTRAGRAVVSISLGLLVSLVLVFVVFPSGCADVGGVPSWERCTTFVGTPAFSVEDWGWDSQLNVVIPAAAGILVGAMVWVGLASAGRGDE